jgi:septum formation protein
MSFYLASASPRRQELLRQIGVDFSILNIDVDETALPQEAPEDYVLRVALAKALAGFQLQGGESQCVVLGGDTAVVHQGRIFGKPVDRANALEMLAVLSGSTHEVYSAVSVVSAVRQVTRLVKTQVTFLNISQQQLEMYWDTGEPLGKAGAYAIQGLAAIFVAGIEGSYSGVVGLPISETAQLLKEFDVPVWSLPDSL